MDVHWQEETKILREEKKDVGNREQREKDMSKFAGYKIRGKGGTWKEESQEKIIHSFIHS